MKSNQAPNEDEDEEEQNEREKLKKSKKSKKDDVFQICIRFDSDPTVVIPIERVDVDFELRRGFFVTRSQFPLILAYGITTHKAQGRLIGNFRHYNSKHLQ